MNNEAYIPDPVHPVAFGVSVVSRARSLEGKIHRGVRIDRVKAPVYTCTERCYTPCVTIPAARAQARYTPPFLRRDETVRDVARRRNAAAAAAAAVDARVVRYTRGT